VTISAPATAGDGLTHVPVPLRERRYDWFFIAAFALFASTSFTGDAPLFRAACGAAYAGFDYTFTNVPRVLAYNLPYIVVPLLLVARMWRPHPFSRAAHPHVE
jgi:hypothetical protein